MVDPITLFLAWAAGMYGFSVRWKWIGGIGYAAVTVPLLIVPILH